MAAEMTSSNNGGAATPRPSGRRPNPRIAQFKRTWYFLRRNTLAVFGILVLLAIIGVAVYATTTSVPWNQMTECFATNNQVVSFHESGLPPGLQWSVTVEGTTHSSTTPTVNFSLTSGPQYSYTVGAIGGYTAHPSSGVFDVAGSVVHISITFTPGIGAQPTPGAGVSPAAGSSPLACTVCTYPAGTPSPGPGCYATPQYSPSIIPPTVSLGSLSSGPLPLGAMTVQPGVAYFYNLYDGMLRGADYSLLISVAIVSVGAMAGLIIGAVSGFWGGVVDEAIMRLVDIFLSIPQILFVIIVIQVVKTDYSTVLGLSPVETSIFLLVAGFMVVWWPFYARVVRGQVLVIREQKYVEAARASGASKSRIVFKHVIPNSMYPIFIQMSLDVGTIPLLTGFLVFLGFRIWPYIYFPEWGTISALATLNVVQNYLGLCATGSCTIPWWQLFFPGLALFLFAISVNFLSDGLRDALDPRLRR